MSNAHICTDHLQPGVVLIINQRASIQFQKKPFLFRLIGIERHDHLSEWIWLEGYQLKTNGDAVEKRLIYVKIAGLHVHTFTPRKLEGDGRPTRRSGRAAWYGISSV